MIARLADGNALLPTRCPVRTVAWEDKDYAGLDLGIRFAVRVLRARGFETCQSCQGGAGHAYPEPTVDLAAPGGDADGFGAVAALRGYGVEVASLALVWRLDVRGLPCECVWRVVLSCAVPERADDRVNPVWGYQYQEGAS